MIKDNFTDIYLYTARNKIGEEVIVQIQAQKIENNNLVFFDSLIKQSTPILVSTLPKHITYEMLEFAPSSYNIAQAISSFLENTIIYPNQKLENFLIANKVKIKNR